MDDKNKNTEYGGFPSKEAQEKNTSHRGMEPDATVEEVNAHDQLEQDILNAEHFGYPLGTPSHVIGKDLLENGGPAQDTPEPPK